MPVRLSYYTSSTSDSCKPCIPDPAHQQNLKAKLTPPSPGFYKGIQSAGAAIMWRSDGLGMSYMAELASNWALLSASLVIALPLIVWKVQDHVAVEDDLKFSDETVADVLPGGYQKERVDV
jgi:hypothetical protein